jgi:hypothetical protein
MFGGGDVLPLGLVVLEGFDGFEREGLFGHDKERMSYEG